MIQLDFFEDTEIGELRHRMKSCEDSCNRVRRKLFAEQSELKRIILDMKDRLEVIERGICIRD